MARGDRAMNPRNFLAELKRRNVYKVAVAYAVVAWLLIQAGSILFPTFEAPGWVMKVFVVIIAAGFPVALVLAWAFEMTPQGVKRTEHLAPNERIPHWSRAKFGVLITSAALAAAALLWFQLFRQSETKTPRSGPERKSIAVLPFENLSEDKGNAYFVDGMHDEIITRLAKIGDLKVISRTSTQRYKARPDNLPETARQLGVTYVLEGSVQRQGDRVRINVQLIDAERDDHLWAEIYDKNLTDIFATQSEVATVIAEKLETRLTGRERKAVTEKPTANLAAYDAYLRGLGLVTGPGANPENELKAAELFTESVRLDPKFVQAWSWLARTSADVYLQHFDHTAARKETARAAAETALRLNPASPDAQLAQAYYSYQVERDFSRARQLFEEIRRHWPNNSEATVALAYLARRQARWNDSLRFFEEASWLNPRDPVLFTEWHWTLGMLRRLPEAHAVLDRALSTQPDDPTLLASKAMLYQRQGDLAAAQVLLAKLPRSTPILLMGVHANQLMYERRFAEAVVFLRESLSSPEAPSGIARAFQQLLPLAFAFESLGDKENARSTFEQVREALMRLQAEQPDNVYIVLALASAAAGLGEKEEALRQGERALTMLSAASDPVIGPVIEEAFARVECQCGEVDRAVARMERLLTTPYNDAVTQALLRIDPAWDALRSHPRFKALVEGPEPKTIYN
jgi:TolB-like protein/predicted Zn-dependent protease